MKERMVRRMAEPNKSRFFSKLLLWFVFLSTIGVGGGIFFLLFAVVPIEQVFTDKGWSQFKIDQVMKYFVFGWVAFGFLLSFLYYFLIVKKNRWFWTWALVAFSVLLCVSAVYYFMNTGTGVIQSSQGQIVEGERFTFGPYPEKEDLELLHEKGYDGVITLLNPTLPIEKPLLDQEKSNAEKAGLEVHSLPMLPWVGDNTKSIDRVKELIHQDEKKYYVHCYLGRHRVDVVKQVINEELGDDEYALKFLQPTTLERGNLYYFPDQSIVIGPYPTDEEWFTRVGRGQVEEVVSLLPEGQFENWKKKEQKTVGEMEMTYTPMPLPANPSLSQIKEVAEYVQSLDHRVFVHDFNESTAKSMLEAYIHWGRTLTGEAPPELACGTPEWIGRKMLAGCNPTAADREKLQSIGVQQFLKTDGLNRTETYEAIQKAKKEKKLTYLIDGNLQQAKTTATGLLYGSLNRGEEWKELQLANGKPSRHERNLIVGPMLAPEEYETFIQEKGVAQLILLYSPSTEDDQTVDEAKRLARKAGVKFEMVPMATGYEDELIPLLDEENGLNYIMTEEEFIPEINAYLKKF